MGHKPYAPAEDSLLLADGVKGIRGRVGLEIATGTGFVLAEMARLMEFSVGTDTDSQALVDAKERLSEKRLHHNSDLICCHGASALRPDSFSFVAFNPPYLPAQVIQDITTDGGPSGSEILCNFLRDSAIALRRKGRIRFVFSSLTDEKMVKSTARALGLTLKRVASRKLFFESLYLYEARRLRNEFRPRRRLLT